MGKAAISCLIIFFPKLHDHALNTPHGLMFRNTSVGNPIQVILQKLLFVLGG